MNYCEVCKRTIHEDEVYFDVVVWEMKDGEGCEESETTMCQSCKDEKIKQ